MMTAVWAAVIAGLAFWIIGVVAAVFLMLRTARLVSVTTAAVTTMTERAGALTEQASAATRRASEQIAATETITASMDEVAATMAELNGRLRSLAPAARTIADGVAAPLARVASVSYGVSRAIGMRRRGRAGVIRAERLAAADPRALAAGAARVPRPRGRRRAGQGAPR